MKDLLSNIEKEYQDTTAALEDQAVLQDPKKLIALGRKKAELDTVMESVRRFRTIEKHMRENAEMTQDPEAEAT
ncbi:MAG: PCRF domain-containing protein [Candidatus Moraniibacteriota bacterium]